MVSASVASMGSASSSAGGRFQWGTASGIQSANETTDSHNFTGANSFSHTP